MNNAARAVKVTIASAVTASVVFGLGGVITAVQAEAAAQAYTAVSAVYVRSGPSTSQSILGTLRPGQVVKTDGRASRHWVAISYQGRKAYVSASYLRASKARPSAAKPTTSTKVGFSRFTTQRANLREDPSLRSNVISVLPKGTRVFVTGERSGDFSQVVYSGALRWVYTAYLGKGAPRPGLPAATGWVVTSANLTLRAAASVESKSYGTLATRSIVAVTGKRSGNYSQVIHGSQLKWILTKYTQALSKANQPVAPKLPKTKGTRYATVAVAVRPTPATSAKAVKTVPKGTALSITGTVRYGFTQVVYDGTTRWVSSRYLSTKRTTTPSRSVTSRPAVGNSNASLGSVSLDRLNANGKRIVRELRAKFPQLKTIYGWRGYSAYSSDHPNGRAQDVMIPNWSSNKALGDAVANYIIANAKRLNVKYIIWRQRNYTPSRGYWRSMSDRGGATANHYDHVHISTY